MLHQNFCNPTSNHHTHTQPKQITLCACAHEHTPTAQTNNGHRFCYCFIHSSKFTWEIFKREIRRKPRESNKSKKYYYEFSAVSCSEMDFMFSLDIFYLFNSVFFCATMCAHKQYRIFIYYSKYNTHSYMHTYICVFICNIVAIAVKQRQFGATALKIHRMIVCVCVWCLLLGVAFRYRILYFIATIFLHLCFCLCPCVAANVPLLSNLRWLESIRIYMCVCSMLCWTSISNRYTYCLPLIRGSSNLSIGLFALRFRFRFHFRFRRFVVLFALWCQQHCPKPI